MVRIHVFRPFTLHLNFVHYGHQELGVIMFALPVAQSFRFEVGVNEVLSEDEAEVFSHWFMQAQIADGNVRVIGAEEPSVSEVRQVLESDGGVRWERPNGTFTRRAPSATTTR